MGRPHAHCSVPRNLLCLKQKYRYERRYTILCLLRTMTLYLRLYLQNSADSSPTVASWRDTGPHTDKGSHLRLRQFRRSIGPKYPSSNSLNVPLNPSYATVEHTLVRIISTQFFFLIGTKHTNNFPGNRCMRTGLFFSLLLFRFKDTNKSEKEFSKIERFWHEAEFNNLLFFYPEVI